MKLKGNIGISKVTSNTGQYIAIRVTDELSRCEFLEVTMNLEDFAKTITNSEVDCEFELRVANVGKTRETKTEVINIGSGYNVKQEDIAGLLAPYEVDGWKGYRDDVTNHHHWSYQKDNSVLSKVTFVRYI